ADAGLKSMMGDAFSDAYLNMKHQEWNAFVTHFSQWEKDNTLDI
ncbi:MAG: glutamine synthetase, partial [Marinibacterium sp.]|nr:glutamine synthetase [Marinibacterium sp.]MCV6586929.1 glutamine synthetase [Marinibacterium sp.]